MSFSDFFNATAGIGKAYTGGLAEFDQNSAITRIGEKLQANNFAGASQDAFNAGDADTGLGLLKLGQAFKQQQLQQQAGADFARDISGLTGPGFGGGQGGNTNLDSLGAGMGRGRSQGTPGLPSFADSASPAGGYLASLTRRESNGNPNARNPNSTATGLGQFTTGTWSDLMKRRPDLALTPDGRTDPQQAMRATAAFTAENEGLLTRAGLPVTNVTRYSMHFLGKQGGLRFLKGAEANPDAPAASYVDAASVGANRNVFFNRDSTPKTARQVLGDFSNSFGGGRRGPAPDRSRVAYAGNEEETQALESRMGMMPTRTAEADMPMQGAQEAAFYIPGSEPEASPTLPTRSPFGGDSGRPPAIDQSAIGGRPAPGQGVGRVMSMPSAGGDPEAVGGAQGGIGPVAAGPGFGGAPGAPDGFPSSGPLAQRIPVLLRASANPNLPEGQRQLAQTLLKSALDEAKVPDSVKEFVWARATGLTQAANPAAYAREKAGPTKLSPGESVYDESSNSIRITAPDRSRSNVTNDVEARRASAAELGLSPGSPAYQSYVLTGKMPREDAQPLTAGDKKAIQDADTAVLSARSTIDMLRQAKTLSKQAYEGPTASTRATVTGLFGSEAGVATQDLDNLVTTQALGSLKAIFGGAPTEGERAILLEIQGSSSKPDVVRQRIYDRAIGLAELRMRQNQEKADELRGGEYYKRGSGSRGQDNSGSRGASPSGGRTVPAPSQDAVLAPDRFQQLMGSGLSKQQAYERLQQEGY